MTLLCHKTSTWGYWPSAKTYGSRYKVVWYLHGITLLCFGMVFIFQYHLEFFWVAYLLTMFSFSLTSCIENEQPKNALAKNLHDRFPSPNVKRLPRRLLLQFMGFNPILLCIYPVIAAPMPEIKEPEVIRWNIFIVQFLFYFFFFHTLINSNLFSSLEARSLSWDSLL